MKRSMIRITETDLANFVTSHAAMANEHNTVAITAMENFMFRYQDRDITVQQLIDDCLIEIKKEGSRIPRTSKPENFWYTNVSVCPLASYFNLGGHFLITALTNIFPNPGDMNAFMWEVRDGMDSIVKGRIHFSHRLHGAVKTMGDIMYMVATAPVVIPLALIVGLGWGEE